ncbi:MAG: Type 1 glutamine amidotransferase-like domain-containing protein [Clostridia bacterium]|nr:Type 1 glutamine amidotransferase-like domain-containing protein [Clostridia bacterium]
MKLLLCSDFKNIGYMYVKRFLDLSKNNICLFINYASDDFDGVTPCEGSSKDRLESLGFTVIELMENFDFNTKIDAIFVRGGNATKLIHMLRKFNQYDKIMNLCKNNVLYIGESAGALLAGSDTEWTLRTEPYDYDVKEMFGENALKGFGFVDKMIFVHCSKYRFPYSCEIVDNKVVRLANTEYYNAYLGDKKIYSKETYITLGNNQVYFEKDDIKKILTYDWSKIPVQK